MIIRIAGVAVDAHVLARSTDPRERAIAARWIAGNLLAARGVRVGFQGVAPLQARVFGIYARTLTATLAAIAAVPALLDPATLPWRWYLGLRALGMPIADRPVPVLIAGGASVAQLVPTEAGCAVAVDMDYRVAIARDRLLVA